MALQVFRVLLVGFGGPALFDWMWSRVHQTVHDAVRAHNIFLSDIMQAMSLRDIRSCFPDTTVLCKTKKKSFGIPGRGDGKPSSLRELQMAHNRMTPET